MLMKIFRAAVIHQIYSGYHVWHIHCAGASGSADDKAYACNFLRLTDEVHFMSYISPKRESERKREREREISYNL